MFRSALLCLSLGTWLLLVAGCVQEGSTEKEAVVNPQLRVIWEGNRYGYLYPNGDMAINPQFDYAMPFGEELAGVNVGGHPQSGHLPLDGKWGFVNLNGRFVINPKYYSPPEAGVPFDPDGFARIQHEAYTFSEGLAAVRTESEWVYINTRDEVVIRNPLIESPRRFRNGLANVYVKRRWGYIDRSGRFVIEPQFLYPADFIDGEAMVVNANGRVLIIDQRGQIKLPQYRLETRFYEGVSRVKPGFRGETIDPQRNRSYTLADTAGRFLFEPEFDFVGRYGSGMAPVLVGSLAGDPLTHPDPLKPTEDPGGRWGWIDRRGQIIVNPRYQEAKGFSEGIGAVKQGGLWAYIDEDFSTLTAFEFRWVDYFHGGLAEVRLGPTHGDYDGHYAYIDRSGEIVWVEP